MTQESQATFWKVVEEWRSAVPDVTVLMRMHRRPEGLSRAIDSIRMQRGASYEIVATWDDPTDIRSLEVVDRQQGEDKELVVEIVHVPPRGYPGCNAYFNHALPHAEGEWVVFLDDDDEFVDAEYFEYLKDCAARGKVLVISKYMMDHSMAIPRNDRDLIKENDIGTPCFAVRSHLAKLVSWGDHHTADFKYVHDLSRMVEPESVEWSHRIVAGRQHEDYGRGRGEY